MRMKHGARHMLGKQSAAELLLGSNIVLVFGSVFVCFNFFRQSLTLQPYRV